MSLAGARRRVVITGVGTLNPIGNTFDETLRALESSKSGIGPITLFDVTDAPVRFAGEVKDFDPLRPLTSALPNGGNQVFSIREVRRFGRFAHLGVYAGALAYLDSGLQNCKNTDRTRYGVNIGVGMGGLPEIEAVHNDFKEKGYRRITPFFILQVIPNIVSGQLSILLDLKGLNLCNVTACATSAHSIGESVLAIRAGRADVMLAGGSEAVIGSLSIGGFASMKALSQRNDSPEQASRPFDKSRDGFVMSEGATIFVLEEWEHAQKRGAKIYAEIFGYGASSDAFHLTSPSENGEGALRAMRSAVEDGQCAVGDIGLVSAHATSTPAGDAEEAYAIASLLEKESPKVAVCAIKSLIGHSLGASGAAGVLMCLGSLRDQKVYPIRNLDDLDPKCESTRLNFIRGETKPWKVNFALANSFGFGSVNACLLVGKAK